MFVITLWGYELNLIWRPNCFYRMALSYTNLWIREHRITFTKSYFIHRFY